MDYYMNPVIMGMCNDLNIEYSKFCGIMAIIDSLSKYHPNVILKNVTAATLLGIDDSLPCNLDTLLGAYDTLRSIRR